MHILRYLIAGEDSFGRLVRALFENNLKVVGQLKGKVGMSGWLIDQTDAIQISRGPQPDGQAYMTIPDVARELGVKQEVAYAFARSGLLSTSEIKLGRRKAAVVSDLAIASFKQDYILATELAAEFNLSGKELVRYLFRQSVLPVAGPTGAKFKCRQYCWLRRDFRGI